MNRVVHHSENISIKYHEQKLCLKFSFSGQYWIGLSIEKFRNSVFPELRLLMTSLIKWLRVRLRTKWLWVRIPLLLSISIFNFSTESAKKQQFMNCYSLLEFIFLNMTISIPQKWKNSITAVTLLSPKFFVVTHFDGRPRILTYRQISRNIFLFIDCPMKVKVSQAQINWFVHKEALTSKKEVHRSANPNMNRIKWVR